MLDTPARALQDRGRGTALPGLCQIPSRRYFGRVKAFKYLAALVVAVAAATLLTSCAGGPQGVKTGERFQARLSAAPDVQSQAQGDAVFQLSLDGTSLSYTLAVSNLTNVTMAHIHVAPARGQSGDVAAWLYPSKAPPVLKPGVFNGLLGKGTITAADLQGPLAGKSIADLVDRIRKGLAYVNVHTEKNPGGEIQGTIVPETSSGG